MSPRIRALKHKMPLSWRRERDSNPRGGLLPPIDLANRPLQPLGYLSRFEVVLYRELLHGGRRKAKVLVFGRRERSVLILPFTFMAEGVGFEPTVPLLARWFSRPVP
jgi:hypothetical protein